MGVSAREGTCGGATVKSGEQGPTGVYALSAGLTGLMSSTLPMLLVGALSVQLKEALDFDDTRLGLTVSVFYLAVAASAVPGGRYVDRVGWRRALSQSCLAAVAVLLGIALVARSWPILVLLIGVAGTMNALAMPATNLLLLQELRADRQAVSFGIKQSASPITVLLSGMAVPLIAVPFGWSSVFILMTAVPVASLLSARRVALPVESSLYAGVVNRLRVKEAGMQLGLFALSGGLGAAVATAVTSFTVVSAVNSGFQEAAAAWILAAGSAAGLISRIFWGWVAGRRGSNGLSIIATMMGSGALGMVLLATQIMPLVLLGTLIAFAAAWGWPGLFFFSISVMNPDAPGAASGIAQLGIALGGIVGAFAFGVLSDKFNYSVAWSFSALLMATAGLLVIAVIRLRRTEVVNYSFSSGSAQSWET